MDTEAFLKQNGWRILTIGAPKELRSGDVLLVVDYDQDGQFCCAMVLRRPEEVMSQKTTSITVNDAIHIIDRTELSYADIVALAGYNPERVYTVVGSVPGKAGFIVTPGTTPCGVEVGCRFTVVDTSQA